MEPLKNQDWKTIFRSFQFLKVQYSEVTLYLHIIVSINVFTDGERPPPYVPPAPPEEEEEIFKSIQKGIHFDDFDKIPVEVTGRDAPAAITKFDDANLYDAFLANVKKAKFEKPTPVQKYAIPIISSGRDLMACAQTGSGKTVSTW